jgi:2-dehydropantoate 2-reductase
MRIAVVGAGQMGSIYGAAAHRNGHDVTFVDTAAAVVDTINAQGLRIDRRDGSTETFDIRAVSDPSDVGGVVDLVLVFVKGWATAEAAIAVRPIVRSATVLATLQNGLGNEEVLRDAYPRQPIVIGLSVHTVVTREPGWYVHTGVRNTQLGPTTDDDRAAAELAAAAFGAATFPVEVMGEHEVRTQQWAKFVLNCASLPTAALTRLRTDVLREQPLAFSTMDDITRETCAIAQAAGYDLDPDERVAFQRELFRTAGGRASMLGDVLANRRTEIDSINGAALRHADRLGVPAPLNRVMFSLVKGLERAMELGEA